jgi:hypothetical protein
MAVLLNNDWKAFKNHLIACEYMQIDPSVAHDTGFIEERAEHMFSQWADDQRSLNMLRTVLGKYIKMLKIPTETSPGTKLTDPIRWGKPGTGPHAFQTKRFWGNSRPAFIESISEIFAKRTSRLINEGKVKVFPHTVNEKYEKKELRQDNFDHYVNRMPKWPN